MKYFNTEYYSSLSHAENAEKRDLGGTSITSEKGTDGKANNSSSYNHDYYMKNKEKWKDNTNTTKEISEFAGLNEDDVKKLKELAMSKGMDSAEYKKLLNQLSKNNPDQAKKIEDALKKDKETGEKEFDLDAAAWDVIRGKYKNGAERRAALGEDYEMVQKRVNELYKEGKVGGGSSSGGSSKSTDKKTTTKKATQSKEEKAYKEKSEYYTGHYGGNVKHSEDEELAHHGILGQKWGVRRFQNEDGTLTSEGRKHYSSEYRKQMERAKQDVNRKGTDLYVKAYNQHANKLNSGLTDKYNREYDKKHNITEDSNYDYSSDPDYEANYYKMSDEIFNATYDKVVADALRNSYFYKSAQAIIEKYGTMDIADLVEQNNNYFKEVDENYEKVNKKYS